MEPDNCGNKRPIVMRGWIVTYASLIHLMWAFALTLEPRAINLAPVHHIAEWLGDSPYMTATMFLIVGLMAWFGSVVRKASILGPLLGLPQLVLVFISAGSCIEVAFEGLHPDGTQAPTLFFLGQMAGSILLAPIYFLSVYQPYWKAIWKTFRS